MIIERAWKLFFKQFAPHVYTDGDLIEDMENVLYPRITFSYQVTDFFRPTLTTFQVWTWSNNNDLLLSVCDKIAEAVPVGYGTGITIPGEVIHEYFDGSEWIPFTSDEFQEIADRFAPEPVVQRVTESAAAAGTIEIWRGTPFLTPSPKDNPRSRVMYGTLNCRYLNTV